MKPRIRAAVVAAICSAGVLVPTIPAWACQEAFFSPSSYTVAENSGAVVVTVKNPGNLDRTRTVGYQTISGTAKAGGDFVAESGTLSFSPSVQSLTFDIALVNDAVNEGQQRFEVKLKLKQGSCISEVGPEAVVTVNDDDPKPAPTPTREDADEPKTATGGSSGGSGGGSGSSSSDSGSGSETGGLPAGVATDGATSPLPSATDGSPAPVATRTVLAAVPTGGGGLSGVAIFGMVAGALVVGSVAAVLAVRERDPATPRPS